MNEVEQIVCRVTFGELLNVTPHPFIDTLQMYVLRRLRAAGIPVIGFHEYQGIRSGTLHHSHDLESNTMVFRWRP